MTNRPPPKIACGVRRREIEERGGIEWLRRMRWVVVCEIEVLQIGARVEAVAEGLCLVETASQNLSRIAEKGSAFERRNVAEDTSDRIVGSPRQQLEGVSIGLGEHVRFHVTTEPVDRRTVECQAFLERVLQFSRGDREALE